MDRDNKLRKYDVLTFDRSQKALVVKNEFRPLLANQHTYGNKFGENITRDVRARIQDHIERKNLEYDQAHR